MQASLSDGSIQQLEAWIHRYNCLQLPFSRLFLVLTPLSLTKRLFDLISINTRFSESKIQLS